MIEINFSAQAIRDPRLAIHAISSAPAWVWSVDGARILWANAAGVKFFGARDDTALAGTAIGPADPHRRQVMHLAGRLPASGALRLERLRGFGAAPGNLMTCACSRIEPNNQIPGDGINGILVAATQATGRTAALSDRLNHLIEAFDVPAAAFVSDGTFVGSNAAAKLLPNLSTIATNIAGQLPRGHSVTASEIQTPFGNATLYQVGTGTESGTVALIVSDDAAAAIVPEPPVADVTHVAKNAPADAPPEAAPTEQASAIVDPPAETSDGGLWSDHNDAAASAEPASLALPPDTAIQTAAAAPFLDDATAVRRRHPLRFMWQMDADGRFSFGSDEFTRLIGVRTAAAFGRLWSEIADVLGLDPEDRVAQAVATRNTWSGIIVHWPVDGSGARLPVELSGLPIYDSAREFTGYRGFGICRDLDGMTRLALQRRNDTLFGAQQSTTPPSNPISPQETPASGCATLVSEPPATATETTPLQTETDRAVETPINVVPFRPNGEQKPASLTAVENHAFHEIARQLSARLESEADKAAPETDPAESVPAADVVPVAETAEAETAPSAAAASWLQPETEPLRAHSAQDAQLFDRLPVGVLIYRLDRLIYANRAFLDLTGYENLHALTEAGGLDALYVEPGSANGSNTSEEGTPVVISTSHVAAVSAHLHAINWDGENAHALIFSPAAAAPVAAHPVPVATSASQVQAEELATILETTAEGILMFDGLARISSCNRSAEALFGLNSSDITGRSLIDLFAPESQRAILDYLENIKTADVASLLDHGRDVLGRAANGTTIPLSVTMGRTRPGNARYFAIFRDKTPSIANETEALNARRSADRLANAKAEVLSRISHEVRTPLNAIIGFAEVMIEERFGALGNERYIDYMKDIRASGERVIAIIDDMLDLSRIESGKLDLAFANQELNPLIEQCVAALQPQANRERIIIRTSLAHALPGIQADARALRQIALNLIGNSIHLANAGGQVIVSTATSDSGEVVLRVRDTGHGLNDNEIAAALAPFRTPAASDQLPSENGANLSLTKALVEANRAHFNIKSAPNTGTLIEVVFSQTAVQAV